MIPLLPLLVWVLIGAFISGLVMSPAFRNGVTQQIENIVVIALGVSRIYALIVGVVLLAIFSLLVIALLIGNPILSGIVFILAILLFFITWLPLGIVLRIFNATPAVVPNAIRSAVAWLAIAGFFAMMTPEIFTFKILLIALLLAALFVALPAKYNFLEKVMVPVVILMCLVAGWKYVAPDSFRAANRHRFAIGALATTANDRGAFRKETRAASTFAVLIESTSTVYTRLDDEGALVSESKEFDEGTLFLLCNQKEEVYIYQGQSFTQVRVSKDNGSFVDGNCYWIETNLLQIGTRDELLHSDSNSDENASAGRSQVLSLGTNEYHLTRFGDETPWLRYPDCINFKAMIKSSDINGYKILYSDGSEYSSTDKLPYRENPVFKIRAIKNNQFVTIDVKKV